MRSTATRGSLGVAILRVVLGVILLATWFDNLDKDLYTGDGLAGFLNWLDLPQTDGGNGSSLGWFHSILDSVVISNAGFFSRVQLVAELAMGLCLVLGLCTRAASLAAVGFFFSLFLAYFGGDEWIWTYVLLVAAALAVFASWGGRWLGLDHYLVRRKGESPAGLLW